MHNGVAYVPASLLLDPTVSPSAKIVWIGLNLHAGQGQGGLSTLTALTTLSDKTVRKGLAELLGTGWCLINPAHASASAMNRHVCTTPILHRDAAPPGAAPSAARVAAPSAARVATPTPARIAAPSAARVATPTPAHSGTVRLPAALLSDRRVGIFGKLLYAFVQLTPEFRFPAGRFTSARLSDLTHISPPTLRRALRDLVATRWLDIRQAHGRAPVHFVLGNPVASRAKAQVSRVRLRLEERSFGGETLMKEWLSLLIESDDFEDNARPGFLVNPFTDERLELDRFYPPGVAFEFNGAQHYRGTDVFSLDYATNQRGRDFVKLGICVTRGITLVVLHAQDLSLNTMRAKLGNLLPLRDLNGHEQLVAYLERASRRYRSGVPDHPTT